MDYLFTEVIPWFTPTRNESTFQELPNDFYVNQNIAKPLNRLTTNTPHLDGLVKMPTAPLERVKMPTKRHLYMTLNHLMLRLDS